MTPLTERTGGSRRGEFLAGEAYACCYSKHPNCQLGKFINGKTGCKNTPQPKRQRCEMFALLCRSAHHTPWIEPRTMRDLWLNPGPGPQLCSCFRLDRATLALSRGTRAVRWRLGLKAVIETRTWRVCVFVYLQGATLWCSQCNAPQSTEPLLLLTVQGHSCPSHTHTHRAACQELRYSCGRSQQQYRPS